MVPVDGRMFPVSFTPVPVVSYLRAFGSALPSPVETRPSLRENHLNTENHING